MACRGAGWKNGVQYCQRNVETTLSPEALIACGYVDDILIGTEAIEGESIPDLLKRHDEEVRRVLDLLVAHKWVADPAKFKFMVERVEFCGHVLEKGTRRPSPGRLLPLLKMGVAKNNFRVKGIFGVYKSIFAIYSLLCRNGSTLTRKTEGLKGAGEKRE